MQQWGEWIMDVKVTINAGKIEGGGVTVWGTETIILRKILDRPVCVDVNWFGVDQGRMQCRTYVNSEMVILVLQKQVF
jgi:hypothetical protein